MDTLFDREFKLTLGIVQFALLSDEIGLCFLGLSEFDVSLSEDILKFCEFSRFLVDIRLQGLFGLLGFLADNLRAFRYELLGNLIVDGLLGLRDGFLSVAQNFFLFCYV